MTRAHLKLLPLALIWHLTRSVRLCYALAYRSTLAETRAQFKGAIARRTAAEVYRAYSAVLASTGPGCHQRATLEIREGAVDLTFTHCHFMRVGDAFRIPRQVMHALCDADRDFWSGLRTEAFAFSKSARTICDGEDRCSLSFAETAAATATAGGSAHRVA